MKLNNLKSLMAASFACLLAMALGTLPSRAQQAASSITGEVEDSLGAVIPGATVTVRDTDRGTIWTTKTSSAGIYNFPQITVGNVTVKAEALGFSTQTYSAFNLTVNQVARVDFRMKTGKISETIEVTTAPPLLQSDSTEVSTVLDAKAVSSLPLATRDINQLTLLAPGVVSPNIFAFQSSQTTFGTGRPYVNGAREQDNNFSLDGMDVNQADNNDVAYVPSPDAIQDSTSSPAMRRPTSATILVALLSSRSSQARTSFTGMCSSTSATPHLNANTWQNKANAFITGSSGSVIGTTLPRPVLQWNEFGGTVGGPIIKNKLFFFADLQGAINNTPSDRPDQHRYSIGVSLRQLRSALHQPGSFIRQRRLLEPGLSALHARSAGTQPGQPYALT